MAIWLVVFITLFTVGESQPTPFFNQTDLQEAMADMKSKSYYGVERRPRQQRGTFALCLEVYRERGIEDRDGEDHEDRSELDDTVD
ncbi:hypothetical protein HN51_047082 [Arachis hypogaea]